jgi:energy-coupling factor transporter ATP-binding protein EcfA2
MISFEQVSFSYPQSQTALLDHVNLEIPEASFSLVVGASGSGKSTLLRCINGLVPHFSGGSLSGNIRVNGLDPVRESPQVMSRHVGFVFQDPESQFVVNQVENEIAFALEHAAIPQQEMRIRVEEVLGLLDLGDLRERELNTLSGGQQQRVAIAAALALRPTILVLDEPTSQLDPQSADDVLQALVRLNADLGITIVLAEHRIERVLPFIDHLIAVQVDPITGKRSVIDGEPRELLAQIELVPPLIQLGKALNWQPLPLTIKEGLRHSRPLARAHAHDTTPPALNRSAAPAIKLHKVSSGYGQQSVFEELDLAIWSGEITVLLGRNGVGKSTLLRTIVGLQPIRKGAVEILGRSNRGRSVAEICQQVAYLPQDPNALLFSDTVRDELLVTLANHKISGPAALQRAEALLGKLGLAQLAEAYPRDLSVGERQRVALAAVSVTEPQIFLLDEPTRGLDYAAKTRLAELLNMWRTEGKALLIVTHDVEFAATIADRIVLLGSAGVTADGPASQILGASPLFAPQVARLFPQTGWLTSDQALQALASNTP